MNCLEFRRRLLTDPLGGDADLDTHASTCPACAAFAADVRAQEARMRALFQQLTPPAGLVERVQLAARFEERVRVQRRWWYAAAAAVLLTVTASMLSLWTTALERGHGSLADSVLNHIADEAIHLRAAQPVSAGRLKWVFRRFGAELAGDMGPVNFAAECLMRRRNGVHLVMPGAMGPITVFFMPGERTDGVIPVDSARFSGQILPTAWGSIAVVGEKGESLAGLGERLAAAVRWPQDAAEAVSGLVGGPALGAAARGQQQDS